MYSVKQLAVAAVAAASAASASSVEPIIQKGQHFFYKNGTQFFIKGIAYQQDTSSSEAAKRSTSLDYIDPLSDKTQCERDVPVLAAAGTNVIRTYAIDPTVDHTDCMNLLADAGIYVISDLSSPDQAIDRSDPEWNVALYERYTSVVDSMGKFDNVIGFFAGNEVTNNKNNTGASAFVKAAVRDTKAYINSTQNRWIGVGYAANDDSSIRENIADYFNCGDDSTTIDFWGYNIYEWCGHNTFQGSGYKTVVDFFRNYTIPVFFAEYGCNTADGGAGRIFEETTELYSDDMTPVIAGGIVYMYFEEANDYGLVSVVNSKSVSPFKAYTSLSSRVHAASPTSTALASYTPTNTAAACPALDADWQAASSLPPTPDSSLCDCMVQSLGCVASSTLNDTAYSDIFGYICGLDDGKLCAGITTNTTKGLYGAYSMCNSKQQLGYVLDQYYQSQNSDSSACDFDGSATTQKAGTSSSCKSKLASASSAIAVKATATGATSSSKASSTSSSSSLATPMSAKALFSIGDFAVGAYVIMAMAAGAAMVAL